MIELKEHQKDALTKMKNGSVLVGGVGTGKSLTAVNYYLENCPTRDIYVFTTARKRDELDWVQEFGQYGIGRTKEETRPGAGTLTVDSFNNMTKYEGIEGAFIIIDEQRLVGSGTWSKTFLKLTKRNRWIVLTATPGDTWMDYVTLFVAHGFYKNRTEFMREHVVYNKYSKYPKVDKYIGVSRLVRQRNAILVEMPYERHTHRRINITPVAFDPWTEEKVWKDRWHVYEDRPLKNIGEAFIVARKVVNSDPDRLVKLDRILEETPRVIVFYNFDYELEILRAFLDLRASKDARTVAEWNGHKHELVPDTEKWVYLVQYTAGAEAWNCVTTDTIVFYSLNYSHKVFEQCQGRIDRMNTPYTDLKYFVFRSDSRIDRAVWHSVKNKKTFHESAFSLK